MWEMEQCRGGVGGGGEGEGKMKRWMEERGQEERRRKDESIISLIRQTPLHYDTLHTHNRIWAHICYQIWACHGRSYNTVSCT